MQDRRQEQAVIRGLRADFTANEASLAAVVGTHRERAQGYEAFANATPETIRALPPDSARRIYRQLWAPHTFDAIRSSIDALIGAGKLGLIQDQDLQRRLTEFLNRVEDLAEESSRVQSSSITVLKGTIPHGGPWRNEEGHPGDTSKLPELQPSDLASLRIDEGLMGEIRLSHQYSTVYLEDLQALSVLVSELRDQLGAEID